jgi:hypothetical protein
MGAKQVVDHISDEIGVFEVKQNGQIDNDTNG